MNRAELGPMPRPVASGSASGLEEDCRTLEPPGSELELIERARRLGGLHLGELAARMQSEVPADLKRAKGWVGSLFERALGASAGSRAAPDFERIGVELKSLPVTRSGEPLESTFVCTIPLLEIGEVEWEVSRVKRKLERVLFIPVLGERAVPVGERIIGSAFLWTPSPEEAEELRRDWEELAGYLGRGELDRITGHMGHSLQVRPKAAHGRSRRRAWDTEGALTLALPRGFYLRARFTRAILRRVFS